MEVLDIAEKLFRKERDISLSKGIQARHFYVLLNGRVKLSLGEAGPIAYMARQLREIIGWYGLIGRDSYSASAECLEETNVLKFNRDIFLLNAGGSTTITYLKKNKKGRAEFGSAFFTYGSLNAVVLVRGHSHF